MVYLNQENIIGRIFMAFKEINIKNLKINPFTLIGKEWALLTAGDDKKFNTMTVSWGNMGVMWNKNIVTAFVRPQRYTHDFIEEGEYFTLSFYPEDKKDSLVFCGRNSGRDFDKAKEADLTPVFEDAVFFEEAKLVFVCKKIYKDTIKPEGFIADYIEGNYSLKDYHDVYMGEIVKVYEKV